MQHAEPMRVVDCLGDRAQQVRSARLRQSAQALDLGGEAWPADQAHAEEMQFFSVADFVDRDDVRMLHARRVLRLLSEALDELG